MHFIFALVRIEIETEKENESSLLHYFSTYRNNLFIYKIIFFFVISFFFFSNDNFNNL